MVLFIIKFVHFVPSSSPAFIAYTIYSAVSPFHVIAIAISFSSNAKFCDLGLSFVFAHSPPNKIQAGLLRVLTIVQEVPSPVYLHGARLDITPTLVLRLSNSDKRKPRRFIRKTVELFFSPSSTLISSGTSSPLLRYNFASGSIQILFKHDECRYSTETSFPKIRREKGLTCGCYSEICSLCPSRNDTISWE